MLWESVTLAALSLASGVTAGPRSHDACANTPPQNSITKLIADLDGLSIPSNHIPTPKIPIWFHVAVREDDPDTVAPLSKLREEFGIVHDTFLDYGFDFTWGGYTRTKNDSLTYFNTSTIVWRADDLGIDGADPVHNEWWQNTRTGNYATVHVWMYTNCTGPDLSFVGMATFPQAGTKPDAYWTDGIHWRIGALPQGDEVHYNRGVGLVHEIGHWLSLFHTFQGGCDLSTGGDMIADTPAAVGNDTTRYRCDKFDSCPDDPGFDQVSNFMSYAGDFEGCIDHFTPLQTLRMHHAFWKIRARG